VSVTGYRGESTWTSFANSTKTPSARTSRPSAPAVFLHRATATLRALRGKGYRVGIVSNWDTRLVALAERIGLTKEVEFLLLGPFESKEEER